MASKDITLDNSDFLCLRFSQGLRDKDILWLLGVYFELVEDKGVLRGGAASVDEFVGHVKYKWVMANYPAMPTLGLIPGMNNTEFNARDLPSCVSLALQTQCLNYICLNRFRLTHKLLNKVLKCAELLYSPDFLVIALYHWAILIIMRAVPITRKI